MRLCAIVGLRDEPDYETNGQAAKLNKKAPTFVPEEVFYEPAIQVGTPY